MQIGDTSRPDRDAPAAVIIGQSARSTHYVIARLDRATQYSSEASD